MEPAKQLQPYTLHDFFNAALVTAPIPGADQISLTLTPRAYQIRHLNRALRYPRFADYSEMGTGKSFTAYAYLAFAWLHGHKAVVVMPAPLLTQFVTERQATLPGLHVCEHILEQAPKVRERLFAKWAREGFPDGLYLSYNLFRTQWSRLAEHYDLLLCDEAQMLKSATSKVFRAVERFMSVKPEKRLYLMTGDPTPNTLEDAYALIRLTCPKLYPSKAEFDAMHVVKESFTYWNEDEGVLQTVRRTIGFKNRRVLSRNLFQHAVRVTKDQALGKRAVQTIPVSVKLNPAHQRLYDRLLSEKLLEIGEDRLIDATTAQALRMHALRLITQPEAYSEAPPENAVWQALSQLLESSGVLKPQSGNKALIFCHFRATVEGLAERLWDAQPALIYGGIKTESQRQAFLHNPNCRVCIAHPRSGGYGFNFQEVCHTVFFFEPPTTPGDFKQCLSRVDRSGQTHPVSIYLFQVLRTLAFDAVRHMIEKGIEANYVQRDPSQLFHELWGGGAVPSNLRELQK